MPAKPKSALARVESLLAEALKTFEDAERAAREGGLGETTVQLHCIMKAVLDVQANVKARLVAVNRKGERKK